MISRYIINRVLLLKLSSIIGRTQNEGVEKTAVFLQTWSTAVYDLCTNLNPISFSVQKYPSAMHWLSQECSLLTHTVQTVSHGFPWICPQPSSCCLKSPQNCLSRAITLSPERVIHFVTISQLFKAVICLHVLSESVESQELPHPFILSLPELKIERK